MKIKYYILYIIFFSFLISFQCGKKNQEKFSNILLKDDIGNELKFEKYPERIISLAPNITETIYELGADTLLVGITDYCNYPPSCHLKKSVGGMINPNIEIISLLNPDLILMTTEGNSKATYNTLINNGYKVFVTNPRDITGIIKMINDIGIITNHTKEANKITRKIDSTRIILDSSNNITKKPKALFLISLNPVITINKSTYINNVLELAGFENIYAFLDLPYPQINFEDILIRNPDYIILTSESADENGYYKDMLTKNLSTVNAIEKNRIIILDSDLISRPGPRITQAIDELIKKRKDKL